MKFFYHIGRYVLLMKKAIGWPDEKRMFWRNVGKEIVAVGYDSVGIVSIISFFMGGVMALQLAINMENPVLPQYLVGLGTRDAIILEFSSLVIALILAGKVGSSIASEIGTMRITQQIDALDIMGINSANYLILPKIIAGAITFPVICCLSIILGIGGGWVVGDVTGMVPSNQFILGLQFMFQPFYITFTNIKMVFFGILITSISSYYGYNAKGGSLQVGQASTQAVVVSSIVVLIFDLSLTTML
ncbi:MAG: ABC transporter permease [Bacteroidales bacterium]|nr:ABC transporter permease [Bacteroidales bacterium]MBP5722619.1 ABC transporter permease [Bacteroidales bacterium]MBQ3676281.1 ABC transporter permease [Bacteroidales bacterium]MBR4497482.1 ABC transporter permease [Bacteroidales bacterium]